MSSKQELRSEETKKSILAAAGHLFTQKGYDTVTMREIAKEAGCSHTTIYIYFKDKEALLHHLSMPPLQNLKQTMENLLNKDAPPDAKLKDLSREFIHFCLANRAMYTIFFNVKAGQVDVKEPSLEINQIRNRLFELLMQGLGACFQTKLTDTQLLLFSRIYFYTVQGIVATYTHSEESIEALMARLASTFNEAFEVLLLGFKGKLA